MEMIDPIEIERLSEDLQIEQADQGLINSDNNAFLKVLKQAGVQNHQEQLNFVDNLSHDFAEYRNQLSRNEKPTAEGLLKYQKEKLNYVETDLKLMEALRDGLYHSPEVNMIDDLEFSYQFEQKMNKMLDAIDDGDYQTEATIRNEAREKYVAQQLKISKAVDYPQGMSNEQAMSLQERANKEFDSVVELYQHQDMLGDMDLEEAQQLLDELLELYNNIQD